MLSQSEVKSGIHAVFIVCITFRAEMVYFTCDACGEQLKKPSVEKHYTQKCRDCYKLTCIDCLKVGRSSLTNSNWKDENFLS